MQQLKYLVGYSEQINSQVGKLIAEEKLTAALLRKFPSPHDIKTDRALYAYTLDLKNQFLRSSPPLTKVAFDHKIDMVHNALGLHTFVSRVQGSKLKAKNEIRIAAVFKDAPLALLRTIVIHELAHLKEKEHNKAFYQLCEHIEPDYHQLEFDMRLYLTHLDLAGPLYKAKSAL